MRAVGDFSCQELKRVGPLILDVPFGKAKVFVLVSAPCPPLPPLSPLTPLLNGLRLTDIYIPKKVESDLTHLIKDRVCTEIGHTEETSFCLGRSRCRLYFLVHGAACDSRTSNSIRFRLAHLPARGCYRATDGAIVETHGATAQSRRRLCMPAAPTYSYALTLMSHSLSLCLCVSLW